MSAMGSVLAKVLGRMAAEGGSAAPLTPLWVEAVGALVAQHCVPQTLGAGVLVVRCDGPEWRAALLARQAEVLQRLQQALGPATVKRLSFEVS
jgi:predicted nucleic acid-binding Zn ribbon protein